jgi:hypothetical protein
LFEDVIRGSSTTATNFVRGVGEGTVVAEITLSGVGGTFETMATFTKALRV